MNSSRNDPMRIQVILKAYFAYEFKNCLIWDLSLSPAKTPMRSRPNLDCKGSRLGAALPTSDSPLAELGAPILELS